MTGSLAPWRPTRRSFSKAAFFSGIAASASLPFHAQAGGLPDLGAAPEFQGISAWFNSEPLSMRRLRGKVVLIDFWALSNLSSIKTHAPVGRWHRKFKAQGPGDRRRAYA